VLAKSTGPCSAWTSLTLIPASAVVIVFTKALSRETAGQNIFVNCVAPRPIDTDVIRDLGSDAVNAMIAGQSN
jgi:NAD(P)-dependent dehydrogenase (short-subunit alcohol dehydrogenase family)